MTTTTSRWPAQRKSKALPPAGCLILFLLAANAPSQATPLNLTAGLPDFITSSLNVRFVPGSNIFSAVGVTSAYLGGSVPLVGPGTYSLTARINNAGVLNSGSLSIAGDIGAGPQTLLTGNLKTGSSGTAFGFENPSDPVPRNTFEFLFTVTGGDPTIVSDFGGLGAANRGVILNAEFQNGGTPFNGTWTSSFFNDGQSGISETFVPEPGPAALLMLGGVAWAALTRRARIRATDHHTVRSPAQRDHFDMVRQSRGLHFAIHYKLGFAGLEQQFSRARRRQRPKHRHQSHHRRADFLPVNPVMKKNLTFRPGERLHPTYATCAALCTSSSATGCSAPAAASFEAST